MSPSILSIGTAVPRHKAQQSELAQFMAKYLDLDRNLSRKLQVLYNLSGIETRYSVLPDFTTPSPRFQLFPDNAHAPEPTTENRMSVYQQHAVELGKNAALDCFGRYGRRPSNITHLIAVSCTGMYAPGLDIDLVQTLDLPTDIERTAINFMGCYAAFNALKAADKIVRSEPTSTVLIVAVELCSIHLQKCSSEDAMVSNALFGDGAAAVLVGNDPSVPSLKMDAFYSDLYLDGREDMGWYIRDFGFEMKLTAEVPTHIKGGISELTHRLLTKMDVPLSEISRYAIHPGGRKILDVIEEELSLKPEDNAPARHVMKHYGNMSSPSVLFVLQHIMEGLDAADDGEHILSFAFGPGLTMESMLLTVSQNA